MENVAVHHRAQYLAWLRANFPELYYHAMGAARGTLESARLGGFLDSIGNAFTTVVSSVSKALPSLAQTYAQYESQKQLLQVNTTRASQGLAPLQYDAQGRLVTSSGIPYTAADYALAQRGGTGFDSTTLLLFGGGALLLLLLLLRR